MRKVSVTRVIIVRKNREKSMAERSKVAVASFASCHS